MVETIAGRIAAGLENRRQAEAKVAALQSAANEMTRAAEAPATIKQIDPWESRLARAATGSEKDYQQALKFLQVRLEGDYRTGFDMSEVHRWPGTRTYADVIVDGKVLASIDNQGVVRTDERTGGAMTGRLAGLVNGRNGPDLAQVRAEQLAQMLGGTVAFADTAMTQRQFEALGPIPRAIPILDRAGMAADPRSSMIGQLIQRRAEHLAQA